MDMKRLGIGLGILALLMFAATPVYASCIPPPPPEGFTPGFWKNHPDDWPISTGTLVGDAFQGAGGYAGDTLMTALGYAGGDSVSGAMRVLLRAGAAALLNALHPDVNFPAGSAIVINFVNAALASGDRATMIEAAATIDFYNNLGGEL